MKYFFLVFSLSCLLSCRVSEKYENDNISTNLLHGIAPKSPDSLVNVVIEIPAGTSQKWEVNKLSGQLEWEKISSDSMRIIDYLSYPANYGFVPRTLLSEDFGGDGDPVDVFVLGQNIARGQVIQCKIIGLIDMTDSGEADGKLIAVPIHGPWRSINTLEDLKVSYTGVLEILQIWLSNYKGKDKVEILSIRTEEEAMIYLQKSIKEYKDSKAD